MTSYHAGSRGQCPHCLTTVLFEKALALSGNNTDAPDPPFSFPMSVHGPKPETCIRVYYALCPACKKEVVSVQQTSTNGFSPISDEYLCWPRRVSHSLAPSEVPSNIAEDYQESEAVLEISPKASAALSRRCLQALLRDQGFSQHDLSQQIDAALPTLPPYISDGVDAIRNYGNFAAHPQKDKNSGAILEVEPGEASWNLEVLSLLFDFYYVQPKKVQERRDALNAKLAAAGKPPMK